MDSTKRGNYESGADYVLEYGELKFTFNERDFTERVEQAATKLSFVGGPLGDEERTVRFRTVGDLTLTGCVESGADTIAKIIDEVAIARVTERGATRGDDRFSEAAMEDRKKEGYF
jgi:3'-phosphoadenosine 5'-phosphosulfate sulfotransferase (PAPS reductase)/FAD synthetase